MITSRSVAGKIGSSDPNQFRATMKETYQQLTEKQRYQIQAYYEANNSYRVIANAVGCHKSTISRELLRCPKGAYCAETAHVDARKKKTLANKATKRNDHLLRTIRQLLKRKFSPSAIAGRSKHEHGEAFVSHETIYQWVYQDKQKGGNLHRLLLRAKRGYRKSRKVTDNRGLIANRVSIDQRGKAANDRLHRGHWEGDTVHGKRGNLVTLVDRKSRYLVVRKSDTRTKKEVGDKLNEMFNVHHAKSLTVDNGREFYGHEEVSKISNINVFFADPFSSWQRGSNENANGLLRRYFPKGCDISLVTAQKVRRAVEQINNMPRKLLGWKTASEVHYGVSVALIT